MLIGYFSICLLAIYEAYIDYRTIISHKYVNHVWEWCHRAVMSAIIVFILANLGVFSSWFTVISLAIATPPIFSVVHRLTLNRLRKLDYFYISPSNIYDTCWILLAIAIKTFKISNPFDKTVRVLLRLDHKAFHNKPLSMYYSYMRFGAHLAYTVELSVVFLAYCFNLYMKW